MSVTNHPSSVIEKYSNTYVRIEAVVHQYILPTPSPKRRSTAANQTKVLYDRSDHVKGHSVSKINEN
jgi:hypothetical protein